jgi:hypothetical protein
MLKRGKNRFAQVSVFIIIVAIIIGAVVTVFAFRNKISLPGTGSSNTNFDVSEINSAIEECGNQRAIDAIRLVGLQGGYVNLPENYLETNISNVAHGYYNGKNILASKATIEKEISYYIELTMPFCIENEFNGFNITKSKTTVNTKIKDNLIIVSAKMPISTTKENQAFTIDRKYELEVPVRLGNIINTANEIINKQANEKEYVPISFLTEFNLDITFIYYDKNTLIYTITDNKNKTYNFMFGVDLV